MIAHARASRTAKLVAISVFQICRWRLHPSGAADQRRSRAFDYASEVEGSSRSTVNLPSSVMKANGSGLWSQKRPAVGGAPKNPRRYQDSIGSGADPVRRFRLEYGRVPPADRDHLATTEMA